jgi:hypothetical protein
MKDSILVQTLMAFTPNEMQELGGFLACPMFNGGSHANQNLALFTLLAVKIRENKCAEIDKSQVSEAVFDGIQKKDKTRYLENRMSELMSAIRKYIAWQEVNQAWGGTFEGLAVARFYRDRDLGHRQEQVVSKTKNALEECHPMPPNDIFLLRFWLEEETLSFESFRNQRKGDLNISASIESLTNYYSTKLLTIAMAMLQQERVVPEYQSDWKLLVVKMRSIFKEYGYFGNSALILLDRALTLMEEESDKPFEQLQEFLQLLELSQEKIPYKISKNLAAYARNYCITMSSRGYKPFHAARIILYKSHLEKGWLYENGKLMPSTFMNMVNTGLLHGELDWVRDLLDTQQEKINGDDKERVIAYCFARYYFQCGQFDQTSKYLNTLLQSKKFGDASLERLVRILELKTLYEGNEELIETQLHNYLMFIRRNNNTLDEEKRQMNMNFIKFIRQIKSLREKTSFKQLNSMQQKTAAEKLIKTIENPHLLISERHWLLEKLKSL